MGEEPKDGACMNLPTTAEWLCTHTGLLRSQYAALAVDKAAVFHNNFLQLTSSVTTILASYSAKSGCDIPPGVLHELSEMCIPVTHLPKALPVAEALLKYRLKTPVFASDHAPCCSRCGLCKTFLEVVTGLQAGEGGYASRPKLPLSYHARASLWVKHLPSFEKELLDLAEAVCSLDAPSATAIRELLGSRELAKSCVEYLQLFSYCEDFFKVLLVSSKGAPVVLLLIETLNECFLEAQQLLNEEGAGTASTGPQLLVRSWLSKKPTMTDHAQDQQN